MTPGPSWPPGGLAESVRPADSERFACGRPERTARCRLPMADVPAGRWDAAGASATEALELARSAGLPSMTALPLAWQTLLAALRGSQDGADALQELERLRARQPIGIVSVVAADLIEWAKGVAAAWTSDTDAAMRHLGQLR